MSRVEYDKWYKTQDPAVCGFCHLDRQIVLKEFDHWVWIANFAPYWRYHTMLLPRRHFVKFSDMTFAEAGELPKVVDYGEKKMIDAKLLRTDGTLIQKMVYFWRYRFNRFDPISGTVRPDHFHIHLAPDKDHLWDPTLDKKAHLADVVEKLKV